MRAVSAASSVRIEQSGAESSRSIGSGVLLPGGLVLTANHVVSLGEDAEVITRDGRSVTARVAWRDAGLDAAVLKLKDGDLTGESTSRIACRSVVTGEPLMTVGNPFGLEFVSSWGRVTGPVRTIHIDSGEDRRLFLISVPIAPGNSGGPLYDSRGDVVGLVDAVQGPIGSAVPSALICKALGLKT